MNCEYIVTCPFFNDKLSNMPGMCEIYKRQYCLKDYKSCARLIVREALGPKAVPEDLFPNDKNRAMLFIGK